MIVHQIEALVAAGVKDIILAVNYRPEIMEKFLQEVCRNTTPPLTVPVIGARIDWSTDRSCF